jgi:acyl CoA:acetate/3-ketoacid CoA transferase beta subunit
MPRFRPSGFGFCTTWRPRPFVWRPDRARTNRCLFDFDRARRRFRLASVHPGHSVAEVLDNTGFAPMTCRPRRGRRQRRCI